MRDDAAKILTWIIGISFATGLVVMGGYYLVTGEAYTAESALESNKEAGFYPYVPPEKELDEVF